jgi:hypothetical protein
VAVVITGAPWLVGELSTELAIGLSIGWPLGFDMGLDSGLDAAESAIVRLAAAGSSITREGVS